MKRLLAGVTTAGILFGGIVATDTEINPYTDKGTTLEIQSQSSLPEGGAQKIVADKTEPKVTLVKWNGEVAMAIRYQGMATTGNRPFLSKNVEWNDDTQTMQAEPLATTTAMEDGAMEINIILKSKPASNQFNFSISAADNLDFFYQRPLWQEAGLKAPLPDCTDILCSTDGLATSTRPENVVGSYAVYYRNHANHIEGQTNYAAGKAYHIFRPLVTDAKGSTVWADLSYTNSILTVTVPQSFLDVAAYPVVIDPTIGYTTAGASTASDGGDGTWLTNSGSGAAGAVSSLSSFTKIGSAGSCTFLNAIYENSATHLNVDYTAETTETNTTGQWLTMSAVLKATLSSGTTYWTGQVAHGAPCGPTVNIGYDNGGTASGVKQPLTWSVPPPSVALVADGTPRLYSAYVTYGATFQPWRFQDF